MGGDLRFRRGRGVVYRATTYDTPLWVLPNRRKGRWNDPRNGTIAQYCALDAAGALAEMVRSEDLRDADDARELRVSIWELRVDEGAIVDFSDPEQVAAQGFSWGELLSDDWSVCQAEAQEIAAAGGRGVLAPSASLPGSSCLTIFGPRTEIAWKVEPRLAIQVPARHIFRGEPGAGVVRDTRFFGDAHPEAGVAHAHRPRGFEWLAEPAGDRADSA